MKKVLKHIYLFIIPLIFFACNNDVEDIKVNQSCLYLGVNDSLTLTAIIKAPEDKDFPVYWESDNEEIVTVSPAGLVVAKKEGVALVSAVAGDRSASCELTVVSCRFNGSLAYVYNTPDLPTNFQLYLSKNMSISGSPSAPSQAVPVDRTNGSYLFLDLISGEKSTVIEEGEYNVSSGDDPGPFTFYSGNVDNPEHGSYIYDAAVDKTIFVTGGTFEVSITGSDYLVIGELKTNDSSREKVSFVYEGRILHKSTQDATNKQ